MRKTKHIASGNQWVWKWEERAAGVEQWRFAYGFVTFQGHPTSERLWVLVHFWDSKRQWPCMKSFATLWWSHESYWSVLKQFLQTGMMPGHLVLAVHPLPLLEHHRLQRKYLLSSSLEMGLSFDVFSFCLPDNHTRMRLFQGLPCLMNWRPWKNLPNNRNISLSA